MRVNEIFYSLQGESSYAGYPFTFIRLTGCNLRCRYCDTEYAFYEGRDYAPQELVEIIKRNGPHPVLITGGEPLLQSQIHDLIGLLLESGYTVLLETGGSLSVEAVDRRVIKILDIKCPSSGEAEKNLWSNLEHLGERDEIKFVIGTAEDYDYAREICNRFRLPARFQVLFSPVHGQLPIRELAGWILRDHLSVRLQIQLHKLIWPEKERGY